MMRRQCLRLKSYWTFWTFYNFVTFCYMPTTIAYFGISLFIFAIFCHLFPSFPYDYATRCVLSFIKIKKSKYSRWMEIILVYYHKLEVCMVVWMLYKLVCKNMANMFLKHFICIHSLSHLTVYGLIVIHFFLWYFWIEILIQTFS